MRRYFLGLLLVIGLLILVIVLIVHSGSKAKVPNTSATLESYANSSATVSMTIVGPIVAPANHSEVQVTVSNTSATIDVLQGYNNDIVSSKTYPNTEASYNEFLHALDYAGFTKGTSVSDLDDDKGYCSTGDRYIFELQNNSKTLERYWTSSCGGVHSFDGNVDLNETLFQAQIPDYESITENANI
jgi:hypothetical protein